jgi:hypothetical protein
MRVMGTMECMRKDTDGTRLVTAGRENSGICT